MTSRNINLLALILIIIGLFFFVRAHCDIPYQHEYYFQNYISRTQYSDRPTSTQRKIKAQEEYEFHMFHAIRTYTEAKDKCWYLPNLSEREKARICWTTAISMFAAPTPQAKIVVCVTQLLIQYGLDCIDEWDYIKEKLVWSEYHFNECERYQRMLRNG